VHIWGFYWEHIKSGAQHCEILIIHQSNLRHRGGGRGKKLSSTQGKLSSLRQLPPTTLFSPRRCVWFSVAIKSQWFAFKEYLPGETRAIYQHSSSLCSAIKSLGAKPRQYAEDVAYLCLYVYFNRQKNEFICTTSLSMHIKLFNSMGGFAAHHFFVITILKNIYSSKALYDHL